MKLVSLTLEGLRASPPPFTWTGEDDAIAPTATVPGGATASALAAAVGLLRAFALPDALVPWCRSVGLHGETLDPGWDAAGLLDTLDGLQPAAVNALLAPGARRLTVQAEIRPDPVIYGFLRQRAARDPGALTALTEGGQLTVGISLLFTKDGSHATAAVHLLRLGPLSLPLAGNHPVPWAADLLRLVAAKIAGTAPSPVDPQSLAVRHAAFALSPDPAQRAQARSAAAALAAPPFNLGALQVVAHEGRTSLALGLDVVPLARCGPAVWAAVDMVLSVHLGAPDVVVLQPPFDATTGPLHAWLEHLVTSDHAILEQVLIADLPLGMPQVSP